MWCLATLGPYVAAAFDSNASHALIREHLTSLIKNCISKSVHCVGAPAAIEDQFNRAMLRSKLQKIFRWDELVRSDKPRCLYTAFCWLHLRVSEGQPNFLVT